MSRGPTRAQIEGEAAEALRQIGWHIVQSRETRAYLRPDPEAENRFIPAHEWLLILDVQQSPDTQIERWLVAVAQRSSEFVVQIVSRP